MRQFISNNIRYTGHARDTEAVQSITEQPAGGFRIALRPVTVYRLGNACDRFRASVPASGSLYAEVGSRSGEVTPSGSCLAKAGSDSSPWLPHLPGSWRQGVPPASHNIILADYPCWVDIYTQSARIVEEICSRNTGCQS
jgi:hypothetical protein